MTSLRHAYDAINILWSINDLVAAMQTGNRIGYHPENGPAEAQRLQRNCFEAARVRWRQLPRPKDRFRTQCDGETARSGRARTVRMRAERLSRAVAALRQNQHQQRNEGVGPAPLQSYLVGKTLTHSCF
jgi:hypothetical protein